MTDDARDIIDWEYFEKSRAELGPGFIRILSYFKEDGTQVDRPDRGRDARAEYDRAGASRAHPQGRIAPARRGAAGQGRRADRIDRALLHRNRAAFPDELVPEVVQLRRLFDQTVELFDKATNPLMTRARLPQAHRRLRAQGVTLNQGHSARI